MNATYSRLDERGLVLFDGADAQAFLHAQLTCDVNGLAGRRSTYGAYCTPKGRALATFLLWPEAEGYAMQLPRALCEPVRKRLSMYILRSKVRATDASADRVQYGIAGPEAALLVASLVGAAPGSLHEVVHTSLGTAVALSGGRFLAVVKQTEETVVAAELDGAREMAEGEWNALEISAGIPLVLPATQEQFVPQMLNLDALGGVSFNKGCYPGQEIVARMHYLGRLKERMFRARVAASAPPQPGDKIFGVDLGAQAAGMVVNAAGAEGGSFELLAVIHTSSVGAGPLALGAADGPRLDIETLPYSLPDK